PRRGDARSASDSSVTPSRRRDRRDAGASSSPAPMTAPRRTPSTARKGSNRARCAFTACWEAEGSKQPGFRGERLEGGFRAGAEMADDLGGAEAAQACAGCQVAAMRQAVEESRSIEVAGTGRVDQPRHLLRPHRDRILRRDDYRALLAAGQRCDVAMAAHGACR